MDRYWQSGAGQNAPAVPANNAGGYPVNGTPATGVNGTVPGAWWYHAITEEIRNAVIALGGAPDWTQTDQLAQAISGALSGSINAAAELLANADGSALVGFVQAGNGAITRTMQDKARESVTVLDYGADPTGATDSTAAFQDAIAYAAAIAAAQGMTYPVPAIELPSGHYVLSDTLAVFPWMTFHTRGSVLLDFSGLDPTKNGFVCNNDSGIASDTFRTGTIAPFLDGSRGSLLILGPGTATSTGAGVVMGSTNAASTGNVRDTGGVGVVITGWNVALLYDTINLYLIGWDRCRFETNNTGIEVIQTGTAEKNAGERLSFTNCTFGGLGVCVSHGCDAIDINFENCSFDYFGTLLLLNENSRYWAGRFHHCHIEAIDTLIVDGAACGQYCHITFSDVDIFPDCWHSGGPPASPARVLFSGNAASPTYLVLTLRAVEIRYTLHNYSPYAQQVLNATLYECFGLYQRGFQGYPTRTATLNRDSEFTADALGTAVTALSCWSFVAPAAGSTTGVTGTPPLANGGPGNALCLTSTDDTNRGGGSLLHKDRIPVRPGQIVNIGLDFYMPSATTFLTTMQLRAVVEFYNAAGTLLGGMVPNFSESISGLYTNTSFPTYAQGQERWIPLNTTAVTVPADAATMAVGMSGFSWLGDLWITNIAAVIGAGLH